MKVCANDPNTHFELLDIADGHISAYSFDTETKEAEVYVYNLEGRINVTAKGPLMAKVTIPDARLVDIRTKEVIS